MKNLISKLHEKPEEHRQAVAFGVSLAITLLILGVWMTTLPYRFQNATIAEDTKKQLQDGITPLATVKASFDNLVGDMKNIKNGFGGGTGN